jgi:hypothetical protein
MFFNAICNSFMNKEGRTFFVYDYGGTGETFVWTTILNFIRDQGKFALVIASSGIAALLLPRGRTPHSHFKIPLDIKQNSMCSIKNTHIFHNLFVRLLSLFGMRHQFITNIVLRPSTGPLEILYLIAILQLKINFLEG